MADDNGPLYLGLDLSTQQLKGIIISSNLTVQHDAKVDFDADFASKYGIHKGVLSNPSTHEVYAPVAMWLEAVDLLMSRLKGAGAPLNRLAGISGAGQQHGSVYWSQDGERLLGILRAEKSLVEQLAGNKIGGSPQAGPLSGAFAHPWSPNWQDASTQTECDSFDACLPGGEEALAKVTGSKAHHRFTGPQILRFHKKHPEVYKATSRISLVSSFLASVFLGKIAPIDISDVCGMNLWDISRGTWSEALVSLAAGKDGTADLSAKLGEVREDGGGSLGSISPYFTTKYGINSSCQVCPFTGDNPATILALPLKPYEAIVSLGTSTTFLMSTPNYIPDPAYHFFKHPTTKGLFMFMLCYKNGGLAREKVRDVLEKPEGDDAWGTFNKCALETPVLGRKEEGEKAKLGLYFPLPEIVPNVRAGTWRFEYDTASKTLSEHEGAWEDPGLEARAIVESQILSLRLRSQKLVQGEAEAQGMRNGKLAQPKRVYLVGGGSANEAIQRIVGDVLGGEEGVFKLDVGGNACALGGAYKAVWACERKGEGVGEGAGVKWEGESFEELIGGRWREGEAVKRVDQGWREGVWGQYGEVLEGFERMEEEVLRGEVRNTE